MSTLVWQLLRRASNQSHQYYVSLPIYRLPAIQYNIHETGINVILYTCITMINVCTFPWKNPRVGLLPEYKLRKKLHD